MAIDMQDPMAVLEDEMTKAAAQSSGFAPFFFSIKDGEKALIRPLLNMREYVMLRFHEKFNPGTKKYDVSAVCAQDFGHECQLCRDAASDKKLNPSKRFYLPIYIHSVLKQDPATKKWAPLTYTDQEGNEQLVQGIRILEMKAGSSILSDLVAAFNEDDQHDISRSDFVIERKGVQLDTTYTVTLKPQARALPADLPKQSRERIKSDVEMARPMKAVGAVVASSNGKVEDSGIPDF